MKLTIEINDHDFVELYWMLELKDKLKKHRKNSEAERKMENCPGIVDHKLTDHKIEL